MSAGTAGRIGPVPGAVTAEASISAEAGWHPRIRLRSAPPLVLRRTAPGVVHLVGVGGGPVAGDQLRCVVRVAAGARLTVRQVAASIVLPSPAGDQPSVSRVDVEVGAGGALTWLGEPTVGARRCRHENDVRIVLAAGASVTWREEVVAGRYGEDPGLVCSRLRVERAGRVVLCSDATVGDSLWRSPAVAGGARVAGSVLVVGPGAADVPDPASPLASLARLDDDVTLVQALGDDHPTVRAALDVAVPPAPARHDA